MGFIIRLIVLGAVGVGGWILGSVYPAPPALVQQINPQALEQIAAAHLGTLDWDGLKKLLPTDELNRLSAGALKTAAAAGSAILVERDQPTAEGTDAPVVAPASASAAAPTTVTTTTPTTVSTTTAIPVNSAFETALSLCPKMTITNAPRADAAGKVANFMPVKTVQGVPLAMYPSKGACLSSGFGLRGAKPHKGVDFYAANGAPILAAGDGVIIEMKYRDDFGNMLLIDHGKGVYTRYAHLASFQRGLAVGAHVRAGDQIGLMGNTASYPVPIHLHYEVLLGDYANPKASFGLTPYDLYGQG